MKQLKYPSPMIRVPHMLHGGDYNPDQWLQWKETVLKEDMRIAKLAGINTLTIGIFAWTCLEPEEDVFTFEWLDEIMDMLRDNGITAILSTPSATRPAWMVQKHPSVMRVNDHAERLRYSTRANFCYSDPYYIKKVQQINSLLAQRYASHPALGMWHLSNEYSGACYCDRCQEEFRAFLQRKYKTLDALNTAYWSAFWSHTYTDWAQIEAPVAFGENNVHALNLDWKRFVTYKTRDFMEKEMEPLRTYTPDVPITTNMMGTYPGLNYFSLSEPLDLASWDAYPQWTGHKEKDIPLGYEFSFKHDLTRGLKNGRPFLLMESSPSATNWRPIAKLHRPGVLLLQGMQAVAHGADSVQYFQYRKSRGASEKFHGAVIDHVGHENTRVTREVFRVGEVLQKLDAVVGTTVPSKVALVYDWENRWAIDDSRGMAQENKYEETVIAHYTALKKLGIPVDIIDESKPLDGYQMLVAPMLYLLKDEFAGRIRTFTENGGTFVATYMTGWVDENDLVRLGGWPGPLRDILGVWCEEIDALYPEDRNCVVYKGKSYEARELCELSHAETAEVLACYGEDFYQGYPALTRNRFGKGKAYYMAARTGEDFLTVFYEDAVTELKLPRMTKDIPDGVIASVRTDGTDDFLFL
ncbi:MAG: beta-galactosidase, partial [Clostridia bacterium]|nr:beta-galactosidase [Clostridia bacterium]